MKTYQAYVRVMPANIIVKTQVVADGVQQAIFLLQGQFGADNLVHLPSEV
jgi:hypothetical protein